jgi:hypothetical protein
MARGRAPGPQAVIRAAGPLRPLLKTREGFVHQRIIWWFSWADFGFISTPANAGTGIIRWRGVFSIDWVSRGPRPGQYQWSSVEHKWGWLKATRMTRRTGLACQEMQTWSSAARKAQNPKLEKSGENCKSGGEKKMYVPKRTGSRQCRHGVLRTCEPRGTDPVLTRMARSACALTACEPDGELTWGTDSIDEQLAQGY